MTFIMMMIALVGIAVLLVVLGFVFFLLVKAFALTVFCFLQAIRLSAKKSKDAKMYIFFSVLSLTLWALMIFGIIYSYSTLPKRKPQDISEYGKVPIQWQIPTQNEMNMHKVTFNVISG